MPIRVCYYSYLRSIGDHCRRVSFNFTKSDVDQIAGVTESTFGHRVDGVNGARYPKRHHAFRLPQQMVVTSAGPTVIRQPQCRLKTRRTRSLRVNHKIRHRLPYSVTFTSWASNRASNVLVADARMCNCAKRCLLRSPSTR